MAYFVAKELGIRPAEILTQWTCEELLVAYGQYVNARTSEYIDTVPRKEWATHKPYPITWLDRWGVLFVSSEQMSEMAKDADEAVKQTQNEIDISEAAKILFS